MADRPPVSVLLPTPRWTDACTEVAAQLKDHDELLLIHDVEDDPITERQYTPESVRLIAAGEPEHCSGKANAIAAGMEAARHDRLVWTDDDFHHPPDWLATRNAFSCGRSTIGFRLSFERPVKEYSLHITLRRCSTDRWPRYLSLLELGRQTNLSTKRIDQPHRTIS